MLDTAELYHSLPHGDDMRLLDRVVHFDADSIRCMANSHRDRENPMRIDNSLPILCGLEYAAQALALHGVLVASRSPDIVLNRDQIFIVMVKGVSCRVDRLDVYDAELQVNGRIVFRQNAAAVYDFSLEADGDILIEGQVGLMSPP